MSDAEAAPEGGLRPERGAALNPPLLFHALTPSDIQARGDSWIRPYSKLALVSEADIVPTGWGVAWCLPTCDVFVCMPLPWNLLFGWLYRAYHWWRVGHYRIDLQKRLFLDGIEQGKSLERFSMDREIRAAKAEAYSDGKRDGGLDVIKEMREFFAAEERRSG